VRLLATLAALNLLVGIACGAFGAHALQASLVPALLAVWKTGVEYQLIHGLGLFAAAWLLAHTQARIFLIAGWLMQAGIVLFSGSLYALALSGIGKLGMITPLGGIAFLVAWALVAIGAWQKLPGIRK